MRPQVLCLLPLMAFAQTASLRGPAITGPVLGYVWDGAGGGIRALNGVPGAASLDPALSLPMSLDAAWSARGVALAVPKGQANPVVVTWTGLEPTAGPLGTDLACDLGAISFGGRFASVYEQSASIVEVWTKLDSEPKRTLRLAVDGLDAIAISDTGDLAAARGAALLILSSEGESDLVKLDHPVTALAWSGDGRLAAAFSGGVTIVSPAGGPSLSLTYDGDADRLETLDGPAVFRLADESAGQSWILDASGARPRILPLPAASGRTGK